MKDNRVEMGESFLFSRGKKKEKKTSGGRFAKNQEGRGGKHVQGKEKKKKKRRGGPFLILSLFVGKRGKGVKKHSHHNPSWGGLHRKNNEGRKKGGKG